MENPFEQMFSKLVTIEELLNNMPPAQPILKPDIVTGDEVCKKMGITMPTLIRWRQKGRIPFFQIGRAVRYDFNKVLDAIEQNKRKKEYYKGYYVPDGK